MMTPQHYVEAISIPMLPRVHNPWAQICTMETSVTGAEDRKERLIAHLDCNPKLILVGNSARYEESRYTGIPFTSEQQILDGLVPRVKLPKGVNRLSKRGEPHRDKTAEIVWKALYEHGLATSTILCNAVPWHPEGERGASSDRLPTHREIKLGRIYLQSLIDMHPNVPVAAVGMVAERALQDLGVHYNGLKDPDIFGYDAFRTSMDNLLV